MEIDLQNLKQHDYPELKSTACEKILNYKLHTDTPNEELAYLVRYYNENFIKMNDDERGQAEDLIIGLYEMYDDEYTPHLNSVFLSNLKYLNDLKEIWGSAKLAIVRFTNPIAGHRSEEVYWALSAFFNEEVEKQTHGVFEMSDEDCEWIKTHITVLKAFYRRPYYVARRFGVSTQCVH